MTYSERIFLNDSDTTEAAPASLQAYAESPSVAGALSVPATDAVLYVLLGALIVIAIVTTNRQIRVSNKRSSISDQLLESERQLSERRIAERTAALIKSEEQRLVELERNATFGELSRGIFHDLMNPLSALSIYAEQMKGRPNLSDTDQDMISKMIGASKRLKTYMDSVRRAIGSEKTSAPISDVNREIGMVKDVLAYQARLARTEIVVDQKEAIGLPIHPVRLHQLLVNLAANAIESCAQKNKAVGKTGGESNADGNEKKSVVTIAVIKNANEVILSVTDDGVGISKENLGRLFKEPFTTKEKGTGIGLMTVKTIVEKELKGTVSAESEEGKGARFVVTIPMKTKNEDAKKF